jgi:hypothetical protein
MRKWLIAAFAMLSLGAVALSPVEAAPTANESIAQAGPPPASPPPPGMQSSHHRRHGHHRHHRRYHTVCHNVRVWKHTPHGRVPVWERRCHRVYR